MFYTRARAEKKVEVRLAASGLEVFLPVRTVVRQWSDRQKTIEEPLFRGYLFAHVGERERLDVLQDEGVVRSVAFGSRIAKVDPEEISALRALQAVPDLLDTVAKDAFPKGTRVVVMNGPLEGLRGLVSGHPKRRYLQVEVPAVAQAVRVHVPADWVMRVDGPNA